MTDPITVAFERGLGPWLFPLRGKIPVQDAWQSRPPVTEDEVREWIDIGLNLGLRTGARSGVFVIDDDQAKEKHLVSNESRWVPPKTDFQVLSPTGSTHHYYAMVPGVRNSASRIAPYVDVRGEGGYVVWAGSTHPTEGQPYRLAAEGPPAECPPHVLSAILGGPPSEPAPALEVDMTKPAPAGSGQGYAQTALVREVARVRAAAEGRRNDTLNRAAFSLGQLVAGGELGEGEVSEALAAAAAVAGLSEREAQRTVSSGLVAGGKHPRSAPKRSEQLERSTGRGTTTVLVPGYHILHSGEYV